jgi:hypothetical protein
VSFPVAATADRAVIWNLIVGFVLAKINIFFNTQFQYTRERAGFAFGHYFSEVKKIRREAIKAATWSMEVQAPFRCIQSSKFLHSLSITSILEHMHGAVNVCKKNN